MAAEGIRVTYTQDQLSLYLDRLIIPDARREYDVAKLNNEEALSYLVYLQKQHLATIPFENLSLHYSTHHSITLHPQALFQKIIADDNGRGGYCMELNFLFGTLLHMLGFSLYSGGARVWMGTGWTGWSHMVNFVTIGDTKYHVDVAFGSDGPVVPMPLDREGCLQKHIEPAQARLQYRNISGNSDPNQRLWVYEHKRNKEAEWEMKYCFTELEFLAGDFATMNYFTSTSNKIFFTREIMFDRKVLDERGELTGSMSMANNVLKWRMHGVKERQIEFETEEQRLEALEEHFGIIFGEAEREGIRGLPSQLK